MKITRDQAKMGTLTHCDTVLCSQQHTLSDTQTKVSVWARDQFGGGNHRLVGLLLIRFGDPARLATAWAWSAGIALPFSISRNPLPATVLFFVDYLYRQRLHFHVRCPPRRAEGRVYSDDDHRAGRATLKETVWEKCHKLHGTCPGIGEFCKHQPMTCERILPPSFQIGR